jgi:hypothetical protein
LLVSVLFLASLLSLASLSLLASLLLLECVSDVASISAAAGVPLVPDVLTVAGFPTFVAVPGVVGFLLLLLSLLLLAFLQLLSFLLLMASLLLLAFLPILTPLGYCSWYLYVLYNTVRLIHVKAIGLSDYGSGHHFFLVSNYRTIKYRTGEFEKLSDHQISDQGHNLLDYRISDSQKLSVAHLCLKGPKHEIFESVFFTQIRRLWLGDLGTGEKKLNFESWSHYFKVFAANFLLSVRSACA